MGLARWKLWCRRRGRCGRNFLLLLAGQTLALLLLAYLISGYMTTASIQFQQHRHSAVQYFPEKHWRHSERKLILLWTKMWSVEHWLEYDRLGIPSCARRCNLTTDRSRIQEADAVLFHWGNMWWNTQLPTYRRPDQVWVLFNSEPPHKQSNMASWPNVFNWTMSYRRDSTIYIPYGEYKQLEGEELVAARHRYGRRNFFKEKKYNISLTISNCLDAAYRYRLAGEINERVPVDMYGDCVGKTCIFNSDACNAKLEQYKFHLALENSYCLDYFSEKFWETLDRDVVPIVAWKQDPGDAVPFHSYINIFDFSDIDAFSKYLRKVLANDVMYNSYFDWRLKYKAWSSYTHRWCHVCDALFNSSIPTQVLKDPYAWLRNDFCAEPLVYTWLKILTNRLLYSIGL